MPMLQSPLKLRATYSRLRKCTGRRKVLFQLLITIPWHFPIPALSSPSDYHSRENSSLQPNILLLHNIPLYRIRDTPLRSLYRLYEDICSGNLIMMGYESDYFFYHTENSWQLSQIPDPRDRDPIRYAILASLVEALVSAFNWKLQQGLRRDGTHVGDNKTANLQTRPNWTADVQPLPEKLRLRKSQADSADPEFLRRNIDAPTGYLYCV
ncbi:hypothetical protein E4U49_003674 [Claviceps purpurea]|nr:hypothetical protein E4U49_003674 [Claviceps purpurea]